MTTIFTRNIAVFIICAVLARGAINNHTASASEKQFPVTILSYKAESRQRVERPDFSALSAGTSFAAALTPPDFGALLDTYIVNDSVGTVNILNSSRHIYNKHLEAWNRLESSTLSNILSQNKIIIKMGEQESEIINQRLNRGLDINQIVNGTALEEIYINQGITKIQKVRLQSEERCYYLLELGPDSEFDSYGEKFLSHIDNIRRFVNR